jgi:hypothetical protein
VKYRTIFVSQHGLICAHARGMRFLVAGFDLNSRL